MVVLIIILRGRFFASTYASANYARIFARTWRSTSTSTSVRLSIDREDQKK